MQMPDYATFSALRLSRVFPAVHLEGYPRYMAIDPDPENESYFMEYLGGSWAVEKIDGVQFWYPACEGASLTIVELWASHLVAFGRRYRDDPDSNQSSIVTPWKANADRVLEALGLALRMGDREDALRSLAAGDLRASPFPPGAVDPFPAHFKSSFQTWWFVPRAPDVYHVQAVIHATDGLAYLEIRRPDLVQENCGAGDDDEDLE